MPWGKIDDGFYEHDKVLELFDGEDDADALAALGVWVLAFTWAHRNTRKLGRRPGHITSIQLRRIAGPEAKRLASILVKYRLWDLVEDGWVIHDFEDYLPSEKTRAERAAAGRKGAKARWASTEDSDGTLPSPDDTLLSDHGNLLPDDGKPIATAIDSMANGMANDGSRARPTPIPIPNPKPEVQNQNLPEANASGRTRRRRAVAVAEPLPGLPVPVEPDRPIAQTLIGEWIRGCDGRPPDAVIGQLSKIVKRLVDEGQPAGIIQQAIGEWQSKGQHPSTLPSFVNAVANRRSAAAKGGGGLDARIAEHIATRPPSNRPERDPWN